MGGGGGGLSKQGAGELAERSAHLGGDRYLIKPALVEFISTQSQRRARPVGIAPVCLQVIPCTRVECSSSSESCSTLVAEWRSPRLLSGAPGAITPLSLAVASSAPEAASHPARAATAIVAATQEKRGCPLWVVGEEEAEHQHPRAGLPEELLD